ncbi:MAG: iron ABC transporter permease [Cyclobacteriaceae bacterium]|nr:iron ABC transporter permease [Cyclobacteriaceae bacterium]
MKTGSWKWFALLVALLVAFILDIWLGSVHIPVMEVVRTVVGKATDPTWDKIIWLFRMPKAITAIVAGGALAVSGLLMQSFFRNPLAGPFVLGISSGASLGVALLVMAGATGLFLVNTFGIVVAASAGAAVAFSLVLMASIRIKDSATLLIIGLMVGSIAGAIVGTLQYFTSARQLQAFTIWTFGSLSNVNAQDLPVLTILTGAGLVIAFALFKPLNAVLLGENYAQSLGVNINRLRNGILLVTSLLAGAVTAYAGPIAFIGIAVPHLTRAVFSTSDHKKLIPAVFLTGSLVLLLCDVLAQLPGSEHVLPINVVTSILGAPVVIWVILKKRHLGASFG